MDIKMEMDPLMESDMDSLMESVADSFYGKVMDEKIEQKKKDKRKVWTKEEIMLLLSCYADRKKEFQNSRKKNRGFANVLKDMRRKGFMDQTVNISHLAGKIRTLQESYRNAKKTPRHTLIPPSDEYLIRMDEIFGGPVGSTNVQNQAIESNSTESGGTKELPRITELDVESIPSPATADEPEDEEPDVETVFVPRRRRKTVKERYYENKLELRVQRMAQQKQFMKEMKDMIKSELEKLNAIEEKKLKILEHLMKEKK